MTIYLDHASAGRVRPATRAAMHEAIEEILAVGTVAFERFFAARSAARTAAAGLLGCHEDEVALIGNTSAGLFLVADGLDWRAGDEVVVFDRDFPANVQPWRRLGERGVRLRWVPMRDGGYDMADIEAVMSAATRLIAVSQVNFHTGFRIDLDALCALAQRHDALVCVDAVQALGVVPIDLTRTRVDFLAAGAHKWLCGPPGIGVFFCRAERLDLLRRAPVGWFGFDHAEDIFAKGPGQLTYDLSPKPTAQRFEGAMLNLVGVVGLVTALTEIANVGGEKIWAKARALAGQLREGLAQQGYELVGRAEPDATSGIVSFRSTPVGQDEGELHAYLLANGCRCSYPDGVIRLSPHYWTDDGEVDECLSLISRFGKSTR